MAGRIWLDVEDIFEYASFNARLTGIQRVEFELCRALVALDQSGDAIGFIRHDARAGSFKTVSWPSVLAVAGRLGSRAPVEPSREAAIREPGTVRRHLKRTVFSLSPQLRQPLISYLVEQRQAARTFAKLLRACAVGLARLPRSGRAEAAAETPSFADAARPGDVILVLGAVWYHPDYARLVRSACDAHGLRFAALVHDLIPLRRPEWCDQGHVRLFRDWFASIVGLADPVLSISRASARDIESYAADHRLTLASGVRVIPMGSGFSDADERREPGAAASRVLPAAGTYALIVSTLEVRKNHLLLFRVWRRLLDELPREQVPKLVFAGRIGWMVADLMGQLRNCDFLDGHVVLVENPTDAELEKLYRGCLCTLFPSFHEGWGLPVTEKSRVRQAVHHRQHDVAARGRRGAGAVFRPRQRDAGLRGDPRRPRRSGRLGGLERAHRARVSPGLLARNGVGGDERPPDRVRSLPGQAACRSASSGRRLRQSVAVS